MAWDKTLPANSSKLRVSAGYIRDNWNAIQTGGVPYDKLKLKLQAANPTREATYGWSFTKDPGTGYAELYYLDDRNPASVIQLTNNGGIGATTQLLYGSAVITSGAYQNTQNAFCSAWALVASNGTLTEGFGLTSAKNSAGDYTLTITTPLSSSNYAIVGTVFSTSTRARVLYNYSKAAGNFSVRTQAINASAGDYEDNAFMVTVYGGR